MQSTCRITSGNRQTANATDETAPIHTVPTSAKTATETIVEQLSPKLTEVKTKVEESSNNITNPTNI